MKRHRKRMAIGLASKRLRTLIQNRIRQRYAAKNRAAMRLVTKMAKIVNEARTVISIRNRAHRHHTKCRVAAAAAAKHHRHRRSITAAAVAQNRPAHIVNHTKAARHRQAAIKVVLSHRVAAIGTSINRRHHRHRNRLAQAQAQKTKNPHRNRQRRKPKKTKKHWPRFYQNPLKKLEKFQRKLAAALVQPTPPPRDPRKLMQQRRPKRNPSRLKFEKTPRIDQKPLKPTIHNSEAMVWVKRHRHHRPGVI